jgi:hypothetical protein
MAFAGSRHGTGMTILLEEHPRGRTALKMPARKFAMPAESAASIPIRAVAVSHPAENLRTASVPSHYEAMASVRPCSAEA